jgi:hypothetical protein
MTEWDEDDDTVDELPAPPRKDIPEADVELLVMAARAMNADFEEVDGEGYGTLHFPDGTVAHGWNALQFSDDAFELAVNLQMQIDYTARGHRATGDVLVACGPNIQIVESKKGDVSAATRRAIVRAAAEIILGKRLLNDIC